MEEARKSYSAYLDTLTDAPEKNMVWLRYFTEKNPTEYMEDGTLDAPFAYDPVEDRILYNPRHPQFSTTDFEMANTHELAHRTDVLNAQGYKNKAFVDAISDASKAVLDNAEGFQRVAQAVRSDLMKDILSALSSGRLDTGFGHKAEYWAKNSEAVPLEIFAELFTMETRNDSDLFFVKKLFPACGKRIPETVLGGMCHAYAHYTGACSLHEGRLGTTSFAKRTRKNTGNHIQCSV